MNMSHIWKKNFTVHLSDRRLTARTFKELIRIPSTPQNVAQLKKNAST